MEIQISRQKTILNFDLVFLAIFHFLAGNSNFHKKNSRHEIFEKSRMTTSENFVGIVERCMNVNFPTISQKTRNF
jgi:hypothetical protein